MYINGYKHPILWWICFGIPFIIYSCFPKSIKRKLFYKYSSYAKNIKNGNELKEKITNVTTRSYTTIEQSRKLVELGLDLSTADMQYTTNPGDCPYLLETSYTGKSSFGTIVIPIWSLAALLNLVPDKIEDYILRLDKVDDEYYIWYDKLGEGWSDAFAHPSSENFIDAAFETVCWLIEQGYIKVDK